MNDLDKIAEEAANDRLVGSWNIEAHLKKAFANPRESLVATIKSACDKSYVQGIRDGRVGWIPTSHDKK